MLGTKTIAWLLAGLCLCVATGADAQRRHKNKKEKPAATAQPDPEAEARVEARTHYNAGSDLVSAGKYLEAIAEFEEAYRIKPHYVVLFSIGMAYAAMGDPVSAVDTLERYLNEGGDKGDKVRLEQVNAELAKQQVRIGFLDLKVSPEGAQVQIDGKPPQDDPTKPGGMRLAAGVHTLDASAEGFVQHSQQLEIFGGERTTLQVDLYPPDAPKAEPVAAAPAAATEGDTGGRGPRSTIGIIVGSVGVALGGAALGLFLASNGKFSDWEEEDQALKAVYAPGSPFVDSEIAARQAENDDLGDSIDALDAAAIGLAIGGGALLTTGLILFLTDSTEERAPSVSVGPGSIQLAGRF
jgi:tetratricopeptide (TPR) repeat protein